MNRNVTNSIIVVSVVVAVGGITSAMKQSKRYKTANAEISALQEQIARMGGKLPGTGAPGSRHRDGDTNEVQALQALLAEKEVELAALTTNIPTTNAPSRQRESWEDRMARMKEEDPEGYAEMIRRREERQQEIRYNLAERTATFMDLDTANMTKKELANHELLVEKMARIWELSDRFQDPEAAPDREAMRELYKEIRDVRPLMDQEREVMFKQLGTELGYEKKDAKAFAAHVEEIIDATTLRMPKGGGSGGRGGGR